MANIDTLDIRISADSKKAIEEVNKLSASLSKLKSNKFSNLENQTKNITKSFSGLSKKVKVIQNLLTNFVTGLSIGDGINEINNYIESMNLFRTTMRSQVKEAEEWADKVNHAFHIDKAQFTRNEGIFMAMATGMGIADEQAYKLSKGLTEMAYDLSSFTNLPVEEAFAKLRSALAGEIEPLRAVGVSVTQATLQHKALELGIKENVNAMTDAEKSVLRYKVILDSLKNMGAIGDFAKTLDSPANALRVLKMQVIELSRAIGSIFIPILVKVLPYIQAFVQVVAKAVNSLARLFGFKMPEWKSVDWGSKGAENLGVNLGKANKQAKKLKDYTMGFDELNIIKPDTGNSGEIGENLGGIGNLDIESVWDESLLNSVNTKIDEIVKKIEAIVGVLEQPLKNVIEWVKTNIDDIINALLIIGSILVGFSITTTILDNLDNIVKAINNFKTILSSIKIETIFGALGGLLSSLIPILIIATLIGSAIYVLATNFDKVIEVAKTFAEKIGLKEKLESIAEKFGNLILAISDCSEFFGIIGTVVLTILQPAFAILAGVFSAILTFVERLIDVFTNFFTVLSFVGEFIQGVFTGDMELVKNSLIGFMDALKSLAQSLALMIWDTVGSFINGVIQYFLSLNDVLFGDIIPNIFNSIIDWFQSLWDGIGDIIFGIVSSVTNGFFSILDSVSNTVKNLVTNVVNWFKTMFKNLVDKFKEGWTNIKAWWNENVAPKLTLQYWLDQFKNFKEGFISTIKGAINTGIAKFNQFIDWLNAHLTFSWDPVTILGKEIVPGGSIQLFTIPHIPQVFKDGGFIEDGLFTMNKGEIAGKFNNGKSVVANNEQIIEGISQGVYQAVMSAMADNNNEKPINVNVYLDGSQINASVERARDEQGLDIFGNELGYTY